MKTIGVVVIFASAIFAGIVEDSEIVLDPVYWYTWGGLSALIGGFLIFMGE